MTTWANILASDLDLIKILSCLSSPNESGIISLLEMLAW